jgi:hypothetical protein
VPLTRAEGPAVNSPARKGGGLEDSSPRSGGPELLPCRTFGAHGCETPISPALRPGLRTVGPTGLALQLAGLAELASPDGLGIHRIRESI